MANDVYRITNASILYGDELEYIKNAELIIENEHIKKVVNLSEKKEDNLTNQQFQMTRIDLRGHVIIPCFINTRVEIKSPSLCLHESPNDDIFDEDMLKEKILDSYVRELILSSKRSGTLHSEIIVDDNTSSDVKTECSNSRNTFITCNSFLCDELGDKYPVTVSGNSSINPINIWTLLKTITLKNLHVKGTLDLKSLLTILKSATIYPSKFCGLQLGCIKEGFLASLQFLRLPEETRDLKYESVLMYILCNGISAISHITENGVFIAEYGNSKNDVFLKTYNVPDAECITDKKFNTVEEAIESIKAGNYVIVVDEESRENEGDLVIAAQDITDEKFLFMLKNTSGVICVSLDREYLDRLELKKMVVNNNDRFRTAFTISCDLIKNTTSGISLKDRVLTIKRLADEDAEASEFSRPGHVFPLIPSENGILSRRGHTESSWELCRLAKKRRAAAIAEIIDETGNTMRIEACLKFAKLHNIVIISTGDLHEYVKNEQ